MNAMDTHWLPIGWAAMAAHVAVFSAVARTTVDVLPVEGAMFAAFAVGCTLLPLVACGMQHALCTPTSGSLTISIIVSGTPWCAIFAVGLGGAAAGARRAMARAGAPRCGTASALALVGLACAPDTGAILKWVHSAALAVVALVGFAFAARGADAARCGVGRVALIRSHMVAVAGWGAAATAMSWTPHQTTRTHIVGLLAETATLLHTAACVW